MNQKTNKKIIFIFFFAMAIAMLCSATFAVAAPNLVVSATQPPNPLPPSASFGSVVSLANTGDTDSASSIVKIVYPRRVSTALYTNSISISSGVSCTIYTPPRTYTNTTVTCTVPPLASGTSINVATYTATGPSIVPAAGVNTIASATGPTNSVSLRWEWRTGGLADIAASISATPNPVIVGRSATATVSVQNYGFSVANNFNTHVSVPGNVTSISYGNTPAVPCTFTGGEIDCLTSMINGGWQSLTITFDAPLVAGTYTAAVSTDTANIIDESNETNNTSAGNVNVTDAVVRLHSSSINPTQVIGLNTFTRTLTVTNNGTIDALNVSLTDRQTETKFVSATGPVGTSCAAWYVTGQFNRRIYTGTTCSLGTIPVGSSVSVDVRLSTLAGGSVPITLVDTVLPYTASFQDPLNVSSSQGSFLLVGASGAVAPTNTVLPVISGNANTGSTLSTTNGTWVGTAPFTYSYQWQGCDASGNACVNIAGATAGSYVVQSSDAGTTLRSLVTATNAGGSTSIASNISAVAVNASPPVNTVAPTLVPGLEKQPGFLWSVNNGTWSGTPTITYAYQWQRCNLNGGNCVNITGATTQYYYLQEADVFNQVRVQVTATNSGGSGVMVSNLSGEIDPLG
jgi:uncharacterized repeat protein (TIGR01451 family)